MDFLTVGVVLGLIALGAAVVYWPMSLKLANLNREIDRHKNLGEAASDLVQTERTIDSARDLAPIDELGVLLSGDRPGAEAGGDS